MLPETGKRLAEAHVGNNDMLGKPQLIRDESSRIVLNDLARHLGPLHADLQQAMAGVLASSWFVLGSQTSLFESDFAAYCGATNAVGVANGTDALELALKAVGVKQGSLVVTVANAGMYSTTAILACGARPIYVDVDVTNCLINLDHLEAELLRLRPAAIVVTHLYGQVVDMPAVMKLAMLHGTKVVEDCAQAHGALLDGQRAGTLGDAGAFSFYPTKNLGGIGDGGAVITSNPTVTEKLRSLRQYGWTSKYQANTPGGRNSRLDELQASALRVLLPHLDNWNACRRRVAEKLALGIRHPRVEVPSRTSNGDAAHLFFIHTDNRDALRAHLDRRGISTDIHFPTPDYRQAAVVAELGEHAGLPGTEASARRVLSLPCFPEITDSEIDRIARAVNSW